MAQDLLTDGFVQLCIDPSLNFYDGKCRVLVEGQYKDPAAGCVVVPDVIVPVTSLRNVDCMFGAGSVLAESLKKIFCECPNNIQVFALPRTDLLAGIAAVYTLTVTGPATSDGRLELFFMDGDYSIDIFIAQGQTATQMAASIVAALPDNFPYTAVPAVGVITFTAKNKGEVGNYLTFAQNWRNRQNYGPTGVVLVMAHPTPGSGNPVPLNYANVLGTCCYNCVAVLTGDEPTQTAWADYLATQWACDTPQCFGHAYTYVSGTLGQVLARFDNSSEMSRIAHCVGETGVPWLEAAAYAAKSCCIACTNPELSIQGQNYGVLSCLRIPSTCNSCWTYDEQQQLRENNFVVLGPLQGGSGAYTSPYIFNDVTQRLYDDLGRLNSTFWDTNSTRLISATALAIAEFLQTFNGLGLFTKNTTIRQGIFGTNPRLMLASIRAWAKTQIGILFSEFQNIDNDIQLKTDFEIAPACQGNPNKLHLFFKYQPPVRVGVIRTVLQPKILDNCDR